MHYPKRRSACESGLAKEDTSVYVGILSAHLRESTSPLAVPLLGHLRARNFGKLLAWTESVEPQLYGSAALYYADAQIAALIKKYPFTDQEIPGIAPEETAVRKFRAAEHRCKRVNQRFRARRKRFVPEAEFWRQARIYITRAISTSPDISAIMEKCDFTSGASIGVNGNTTNVARKLFASSWSVTPGALPYAMTALGRNIHAIDCILPGAIKCYDPDLFRDRVRSRVEYTNCNNITFVPKTAKTHRSIAVEPLLNGFVQKGIDVVLREKLRGVGIDLEDQTRNQRLSYEGSLGAPNPYCTIDLSAASDSLAIEVVRELLPPDWFELLNVNRSPWYELGGASLRYEKFCSMGNGFCFPLQTLIFASVCYAALVETKSPTEDFAVYGDDIVVRQNVALLVIERLRDLGFKTNRDKTFITGPFRESCGRDWYEGQDVRPVFLKERITDIRQLCSFHNSTWRSNRTTEALTGTREYCRSFMPQLLRPGVEPGDTCFSVPVDLAMTSPWVWWSKKQKDVRKTNYQSWSWREIYSKPVLDNTMDFLTVVEHANALEYAVLRGSKSSAPFPLRYTTKPKWQNVSRPHWTRLHDAVLDPPYIYPKVESRVCANARRRFLVDEFVNLISLSLTAKPD